MSEHRTTGGVSFAGALTIAFVVLKLCGVIDWDWLWVLAPLWVSAIIAAVIAIVAILVMAVKGWRQ